MCTVPYLFINRSKKSFVNLYLYFIKNQEQIITGKLECCSMKNKNPRAMLRNYFIRILIFALKNVYYLQPLLSFFVPLHYLYNTAAFTLYIFFLNSFLSI
jgi:hypothetical protein